LAESINAMGDNLVRARNQERQFLLSVSHELRTPLTSIRGYADAIIDGAIADPTVAAGVIVSESQRLDRLVQDLLDLARLDAHRFSFDLHPVDAVPVVRRAVDGFRHRATELTLELVLATTTSPLWVVADADRLAQIVANLIDNAASFAQGRIVIGVGRMSRTDHLPDPAPTEAADRTGLPSPSGEPAIWVVDDGPGIRQDQLALVFDRHFRSDQVEGRRQGTGLGLAIVAELAAAMGANVEARSPAPIGTSGRPGTAGGPGTGMVVWLQPAVPAADGTTTDG
jgi:two-component system sensor histidine kinase BaeS